jgi:hypothetical protein
MFVTAMYHAVGRFVALALALGLPAQGVGRSPHEVAGVGAAGTIGRGSIPEERPAVLSPVRSSPTDATYDRLAPVVARPTNVTVAPSRPVTPTTPGYRRQVGSVRAVANEPALVRSNPYRNYHRSWLHGYWNVHHSGSLTWRFSGNGSGSTSEGELAQTGTGSRDGGLVPHLVARPGMGRGWGLPAWLIGPMVYDWGYLDFTNPFNEVAAPVDPGRRDPFDYSHPVNVVAEPPDEALFHQALDRFHEARMAFRREDFMEALKLTDATLRMLPNDPALHEFRALNLLALHRYREAASALHAVIAVVPGWDWTTLTNLYDHPETYTRQLRILETFAEENPRSADARFLLACQYFTTGYDDAAIAQLKIVHALQPNNQLVARLIREFQPSETEPSPHAAAPAGTTGVLEGTWTSHPRKDTTITLTFQRRGRLIWEVNRRGQVRKYEGDCASDDGTLTLSREHGESMVGDIIWGDEHQFNFRILESQTADPGLSFAKSS